MEDHFKFLETSSSLAELRPTLSIIAKDSESKFIRLGDDLQSVYSDAEAIARLVAETAGILGGDRGDNLVMNTGNLTREFLGRLDSFKSEGSEIFPWFQSCFDNMKRLNKLWPPTPGKPMSNAFHMV